MFPTHFLRCSSATMIYNCSFDICHDIMRRVQCVQADDLEGVPLYEQCGGMHYEGATQCIEGATCVEINEYYSQCRPEE